MEAVDLENNYLVSTDDYQAAYDAVSHLIEQGRKRIAIYITKLPENRMNFEKLRLHGYNAALMDHGLQPKDELIRYSDFNIEGGVYTTRKMFNTMEHLPDAILCMSDTVSWGCVKTLLENGISVPDDIAVVAIDDLQCSEYFTPSITCIAQAFDIIGEESVRLLNSVINGEINNGRKIYVPHKLVVRQSSTVSNK
jgi:DNA-binding LacI/PurR family transcriptional regulator